MFCDKNSEWYSMHTEQTNVVVSSSFLRMNLKKKPIFKRECVAGEMIDRRLIHRDAA